MIYLSNTLGTNFIQSLPRVWRQMFAQSDQLKTAYAASEQLMAQAYMDLLQDALGSNIQKQRLFRRLLFRNHLLSASDRFIVPGFPGQPTLHYIPISIEDKGWKINRIRYIGNSLIAPTLFWERGVDFEMVLDGSVELRQARSREPLLPNQDYVAFNQDPFLQSALPPKETSEDFFNIVSPVGAAVDYPTLGVTASSGHIVRITFDADGRVFELPVISSAISQLEFDTAYLTVMDSDTTRLSNRGFTFELLDSTYAIVLGTARGRFIEQTIRVKQVAVWFADLLADDYALSEVYGALLGVEETSTESYKNLLRGLLQYYVAGNSLKRTESVVHVIAGLPVFDSANESILQVTTTGAETTILTDTTLYHTDPNFPLADAVLKATADLDGHVPDGAARWIVAPNSVDLKQLGVDSTHSIRIADGTAPGVDYVATIIKTYNNHRLLVTAGTAIPAGAGTYWGFSIGSIAPNYEDVVPMETDIPVEVESFTQDTTIEFDALDPLTSAISVEDYITMPEWWEKRLISREVFEDDDIQRRTATQRYFPTKIGTVGLRIGDPMWKIGADEQNKNPSQQNVIIQIPFFNKTLINNKEFRRGEIVQSIMGRGNGEGYVLFSDKSADILYVKQIRGRFYSGDTIFGVNSRASGIICPRSRVRLQSTTGMPLGSLYSSTNLVYGMGTAVGRIQYKIGTSDLELYEHTTARRVQPGDTLQAGAVSSLVLSVEELGLAPAHRDIASYMMANVWQYQMLHISYDLSSFTFPRGLARLRELVMSGAEDRLFIYIEPFTGMTESIPPPEETLALLMGIEVSDTEGAFDTQIKIGGPGPGGAPFWKIGDPGYVIGGANPAYTAANVASYAGDAQLADLAIQIVIT